MQLQCSFIAQISIDLQVTNITESTTITTDNDSPLTFNNTDGSYQYISFCTDGTRKAWLGMGSDNSLSMRAEGGDIYIEGSNFKLINGFVSAREVMVTTETFPDFVFKKDYKLMPLKELESFIGQNGHLPQVPTEKEAVASGINLGDMNKLLLQKIEELTLYTLELNKLIDKQGEELNQLKEMVK